MTMCCTIALRMPPFSPPPSSLTVRENVWLPPFFQGEHRHTGERTAAAATLPPPCTPPLGTGAAVTSARGTAGLSQSHNVIPGPLCFDAWQAGEVTAAAGAPVVSRQPGMVPDKAGTSSLQGDGLHGPLLRAGSPAAHSLVQTGPGGSAPAELIACAEGRHEGCAALSAALRRPPSGTCSAADRAVHAASRSFPTLTFVGRLTGGQKPFPRLQLAGPVQGLCDLPARARANQTPSSSAIVASSSLYHAPCMRACAPGADPSAQANACPAA